MKKTFLLICILLLFVLIAFLINRQLIICRCAHDLSLLEEKLNAKSIEQKILISFLPEALIKNNIISILNKKGYRFQEVNMKDNSTFINIATTPEHCMSMNFDSNGKLVNINSCWFFSWEGADIYEQGD